MIGLVIFVLILPVQVFAAGEDSSSENSRTEDNMTETDLENTGGNRAENLGADRGKGSGYGNPETVP